MFSFSFMLCFTYIAVLFIYISLCFRFPFLLVSSGLTVILALISLPFTCMCPIILPFLMHSTSVCPVLIATACKCSSSVSSVDCPVYDLQTLSPLSSLLCSCLLSINVQPVFRHCLLFCPSVLKVLDFSH